MTYISLPRHQRTVTFGDTLTRAETLELVTQQAGTHPLYPMPVGHGADTFRLDHATPENVLETIMLGESFRIVDAAEAWSVSRDAWDLITVPLQEDRYLLLPLMDATLTQIYAHHAHWEAACLTN